ncbi:fungal-specific transcription factor domain-containing protein [Mariannaea sp. PMI_226]|nr:fungal-specific transcription factor domain-containing protein [Mariannaea sp. PMI_226]
MALRYYVQRFNAMLTTNLEHNGFLSVLLPMAIEDRPLLDMLVAWSSSHLSLCEDRYHIEALEHRSTAIQSFTSLLRKYESPETSLACCLVFCSMSAILGDTTEWQIHLVAAANIIRHVSPLSSYQEGLNRLSATYEGRWLLRNFAYHDVLMSVTSDRRPLIPGHYWISRDKTELDSYVGLASELLALISEVSSLNGELQQKGNGTCSSQKSDTSSSSASECLHAERSFTLTLAYNIETQLLGWICPDSSDVCMVSLAESYRSAALIHLYRVMRRRIPGACLDVDAKTSSHVAAVIHHVGQMPLGCLPECTSLFPLFMAGGETRSKGDMQFFRERLQHIATYRHFHNAASALSVLEELWLQHTSITGLMTGLELDWLDILERRSWSLALS